MSNERPAPKQYEARLIQLLRLRFEQAKFKVEDHLKVGELPLEIDMIVVTPEEEMLPDISKLPPLFHYFRRYNVMVKQETIDRFIETLGQERVMAVLSQKMGREKLLANFRKEELLAALNKEDVLAAFGEEDILKSLQAQLGPELFQQLLDKFSRN